MLSYVHAFHAGNHADILKHAVLTLILESLTKKAKPFTVFDTHSGSGIYNLSDERLEKTKEAESGIRKLMIDNGELKTNSEKKVNSVLKDDSANQKSSIFNYQLSINSTLSTYFSIYTKYTSKNTYPGSPLIENEMLREGDVQILSELHPAVFEELKNCFYQKRKAEGLKVEPQIHKRNGYEMLTALTPPEIKRGLAVIDPSFEDASDFAQCGRVIAEVHKKWPVGIIALWYPLVAHRTMEISSMKEQIAASVTDSEPKILDIQLEIKNPEEMTGLASLYGSGMYIVNFPYQLDEKMKEILPALSEILGVTSHKWLIETR